MNKEKMLLNKNGTIGVFAPSSWVERQDIENSKTFLENLGYRVYIHPQTYDRENQFAGSLSHKRDTLYDLWDNPDITHIWAAGGGNRALHLLDIIDFERIRTPKNLIGFSDVTALLNAIYAHNKIIAYHAPTFNRLYKCPQRLQCIQILSGNDKPIAIDNAEIIRGGHARGHLIGGNLSVFHYLPAILGHDFYQSGILFMEDCNEELSRIDRMLQFLKAQGVLANIFGLICGQFAPIPETGKPYGLALRDIIKEHTYDYDYPVIMNAPIGHGENLFTLPIGRAAYLTSSENSACLHFE